MMASNKSFIQGTEEAALEEGFYSGMMSDCDGEMLPDGMGVLEYREGDRSRRKRQGGSHPFQAVMA